MIKNDWIGYFICPNCKRIHSVYDVKTDVIYFPWKKEDKIPCHGINYNQEVKYLCKYCDGLIYGFNNNIMFTQYEIIEKVIFLTNGKLVFIPKRRG